MKKVKQSFTLIEILVVIVIIGILSSFIFFTVNDSVEKANIAKTKMFEEAIRNNLLMNLVSEWSFDNLTGTIGGEISTASGFVKDDWGSNNGTAVGSPKLKDGTDCISGKCLEFDGASSYIDCENDSSLDITDEITISVWIKPQLDDNYRTILSRGYSVNNNKGYSLFIDTNNKFSTYFFNSAGTIIDKRFSVLEDNTWQHIVISFNGSVGNGYLNSVYKDSFNCDGLKGSDYKFIIGRLSQSAGWYFNGSIDEIKIYNVATTESQIKQEYLAGLNNLYAKDLINQQEYNQRINLISYE